MDYILVFANTHNALHCEKILEEINFDIRIMPTPSYITNSCGISIGIKNKDLNEVNKIIKDGKIYVKFIYDINKKSILNNFDF